MQNSMCVAAKCSSATCKMESC